MSMNSAILKIFLILSIYFCILCANDFKNQVDSTQESNIKLFPTSDLIKSNKAKEILYPHIKIEFSKKIKSKSAKKSNKNEKIIKKDIIASKVMNNLFEDTKEACINTFLYALKSLQEEVLKNEATKIINISNYFNNEVYYNKKQFQCKSNFLFVRVVLKGDIVK